MTSKSKELSRLLSALAPKMTYTPRTRRTTAPARYRVNISPTMRPQPTMMLVPRSSGNSNSFMKAIRTLNSPQSSRNSFLNAIKGIKSPSASTCSSKRTRSRNTINTATSKKKSKKTKK